MKVYDLRGKDLSDPIRTEAYPEAVELWNADKFQGLKHIHLLSTRWYFDASEERNADEAARVIGELCLAAETGKFYADGYRPLHVVVDNFGGTVVGIRKS